MIRRAGGSLLAAMIALAPADARATKTVSSPSVTKGETELEWRGSYTHDDDSDSRDGAWKQRAMTSYGFTESLMVEFAADLERPGNGGTEYSATKLDFKYEILERGKAWIDLGVKGGYTHSATSSPDKVELKLLAAKDMGNFSHRANIGLERDIGDDADNVYEGTFSWSSRYKASDAIQPGIELYSNVGDISESSDFDDQSHQLGPVLYGKAGIFNYEAGYLVGLTDASSDGEAKAVVEYKF